VWYLPASIIFLLTTLSSCVCLSWFDLAAWLSALRSGGYRPVLFLWWLPIPLGWCRLAHLAYPGLPDLSPSGQRRRDRWLFGRFRLLRVSALWLALFLSYCLWSYLFVLGLIAVEPYNSRRPELVEPYKSMPPVIPVIDHERRWREHKEFVREELRREQAYERGVLP